MSRFEHDIREMLHRRSADIDGLAGARSAPAELPRVNAGHSNRRLVGVAATVAVLAGALGWVLSDRGPASTEVGESVPVSTVAPTTAAPLAVDTTTTFGPTTAAPAPSVPEQSLDGWRASLPEEFDPRLAPPVAAYGPQVEPLDAARQFVQAELAGIADDVEFLAVDPAASPLTVVRWSWTDGPGGETVAGHIVVYEHTNATVIAAATTDGVDLSDVARGLDGVIGTVRHDRSAFLVVDVLVYGQPAPLSPFLEEAAAEPLGTAGETAGSVLSFAVGLERFRHAPAIVTARHIGGTVLSITAFGTTSIGFPDRCLTPAPSFEAGVGVWFTEFVAGPIEGSPWPSLFNQDRTHYVGDFGTLEILRPALPEILPLPDAGSDDEPQAFSSNPAEGEVNIFIGSGNDPCDWTQFSLRGDPGAIDWWRDAIVGQWTLGFPLSLAELDPTELGAPTQAPAIAPVPDLVAGGRVAEQLPAVPLTGSCDGLPDAAPFVGTGPQQPAPSTIEALEAFLATKPLDDMLPAAGYVVIEGPDDTLGYVIDGDRSAVVVIAVERADDGWRVVRWEAAAC